MVTWKGLVLSLLTDANLKLLYKTFCRMEPFGKLNMPQAHQIKLKVTRRKDIMGEFAPDENTIYISSAKNAHFDTICKTLLHEMVHLYCFKQKEAEYYDHDNKRFKSLIKHIASLYGFDPKEL